MRRARLLSVDGEGSYTVKSASESTGDGEGTVRNCLADKHLSRKGHSYAYLGMRQPPATRATKPPPVRPITMEELYCKLRKRLTLGDFTELFILLKKELKELSELKIPEEK